MKKILSFPVDTKLLYLLFSYLFVKQIIQKRVVFDQLMRLKPEKQSKLATNSNSPSEKHSLERFLWGNADCLCVADGHPVEGAAEGIRGDR